MKKLMTISLLMAGTMGMMSSCSSSEDTPVPTPPDGGNTIVVGGVINPEGTQDFEITGNQTLKKGTYLMKGWCYVTEGATLTIEPGTVIKGDKDTKAALVVEPGGKLIAEGTVDQPIVFTSEQEPGNRRPGDWGGVILCGKATNNKGRMPIEGGPRTIHGGNDDNDNSGILRYVRIEFAGFPFAVDQEINGLTMGSVGRGTTIDHIQVSYCNDDSYEWFGGAVNCKYLIAYHGWDDEFDTDNGYSGNVQFFLGIRNPRIADTSYSNGFESDNNADGASTSPYTNVVFSNGTLVGPMGQVDDFSNTKDYTASADGLNPNNGSKNGVFQAAMQIRRNSKLNCFNTVALGWPVGLLLDAEKGNPGSPVFAENGDLKLRNIFFAGMGVLGSDINKGLTDQYSADGVNVAPGETRVSNSHTFFLKSANNNKAYDAIADLKLKQPNSKATSPNYGPVSGSPLLNAADFTDALLTGSFFTRVSYVGAFASDSDVDNWTKGWANFDPQNTRY